MFRTRFVARAGNPFAYNVLHSDWIDPSAAVWVLLHYSEVEQTYPADYSAVVGMERTYSDQVRRMHY